MLLITRYLVNAIRKGEIYMEENRTTCPCCPNHCESGALQCGKGRAYFENGGQHCGDGGDNRGENRESHREGSREGKRPDHRMNENRRCHGEEHFHGEGRRERGEHGRNGFVIEEKLQGQLRACGRFLHYNMGEKAGQARIISVLMERGAITQRELQDILEVRSGSLSEILNKVESAGLIERRQSERDKRQLEVKLTEDGVAAGAKMQEERGCAAEELFTSLSDDEKKTLAGLLDKLLGGWEGLESERGRRGRRHGRREFTREDGRRQ